MAKTGVKKGARKAAPRKKAAAQKPAAKKAAAKKAVPKRTPATKTAATHTESEDDPWTITIPNHEQRKDSPLYVQSRAALKAIVDSASAKQFLYPLIKGEPGYQDHHGGGLWVWDADGWLFIKNIAGLEWSSQFCADPQKIEKLRQFAQRVYRAFPESIAKITAANPRLTVDQLRAILDTPITDAAGVDTWVDSIFNASVPLDAPHHTGVLTSKKSVDVQGGAVGGVHHYPTPITDMQFIKFDDFRLWVTDDEGQLAAVTPVSHRGSGDGRVRVEYATPGTKLQKQLTAAHAKGDNLIAPAGHTLAKQAFKEQE